MKNKKLLLIFTLLVSIIIMLTLIQMSSEPIKEKVYDENVTVIEYYKNSRARKDFILLKLDKNNEEISSFVNKECKKHPIGTKLFIRIKEQERKIWFIFDYKNHIVTHGLLCIPK